MRSMKNNELRYNEGSSHNCYKVDKDDNDDGDDNEDEIKR